MDDRKTGKESERRKKVESPDIYFFMTIYHRQPRIRAKKYSKLFYENKIF